ncbi:hypothetical protein [Streptomyces chattanoogensis]|uniref:Uncharacterized protein n=1 Tax=Streptomyces chattanoogensis TaxID=66876 RepID=A0A0N0XWQ5_9ACTN|nr:hypothetical protein [Streptomyces chattanoogensis]KPC64246.1 hypothetical protein ADL29_11950 [Streptomyces chattanoogensis]
MPFNLPVQNEIDRSEPIEPFLVLRPFLDDGQPSLARKEVGGNFGDDVGDPPPYLCRDPRGEECQVVPGTVWGGLL